MIHWSACRSYRVFRGGSWGSTPQCTRVAYRDSYLPDFRGNRLGLRLMRRCA